MRAFLGIIAGFSVAAVGITASVSASHAALGVWDPPRTISAVATDANSAQIVMESGRRTAVWISGSGVSESVVASVSTDGLTWSSPVAVSAVGELASIVSVVSDGGIITAVWRAADATNFRVQASSSTDNGLTWTAPDNLSPPGEFPYDVNVAAGGDTIAASWVSVVGGVPRVGLSVSVDGGDTWAASGMISSADIEASQPNAVVRAATVIVSWAAFDTLDYTIQARTSINNGVSFSTVATLPTLGGPLVEPQVLFDGVTVTLLAKRLEGNFVASRSTDSGATWSALVDVSNGSLGESVSLDTVSTDDGVIVATWAVNVDGALRIQVSRSTDRGASWSTPMTISASGQPAGSPELATKGDIVVLAWGRFNGVNFLSQAALSSDVGVSFSAPVTLSAAGQSAFSVQPATDGFASTVVWTRSDGTNTRAQVSSLSKAPAVTRLSGPNRYETAAAISGEFETGVPVVYLATGTNYPDALSAASAAASQGGPLLLTQPNEIPEVIADELVRLDPALVVIVGGQGVVSQNVENQVDALLPAATVRRDSGPNRYATSRAIAEAAFGAGVTPVAYIATGRDFPDALSASAAAAAQGGPVILVDGKSSAIDAPTEQLFDTLGIQRVVIAGGTGAVSSSYQASLNALLGSSNVVRQSGADRYATSVAINAARFENVSTMYLATGRGFADALAGAALAGRDLSPLYVVPGSCVPAGVLSEITRLSVDRVVLLGGTGVLTAAVESLTPC